MRQGMRADGSQSRPVTPKLMIGLKDANHYGEHSQFSPDGSLILFSNAHNDRRGIVSNIYTVHPDGSGLKQITHEQARINDKPDSWSPDGKQIMFVRETPRSSSLYVMNADGTGMTQVTHGLHVHGGSWGTHP
jgi:Tol biopolymer transport system component